MLHEHLRVVCVCISMIMTHVSKSVSIPECVRVCICVLVCVYSPLLSGCSSSAGGGGKSSSSLLESGLVETDIASLRSVTETRKTELKVHSHQLDNNLHLL